MKELIRVLKAIISIAQQSKLIQFKGKNLQQIENQLDLYYQCELRVKSQ